MIMRCADATTDDSAAPCRHCGQPVELGVDGVLLRAPLGLDGRVPMPYVAHLRCQIEVLAQLAEASHEAIARWKITAAGAAVLANHDRGR